MKKLMMAAVVALGLAGAARAEALLWMVDDPVIEGWYGATYKITDEIPVEGTIYRMNGARVSARDSLGNTRYLPLTDRSGVFDENVTGTLFSKEKDDDPATLPLWADLGNTADWSFAIELGYIDGDGNWLRIAVSNYATAEELRKHIAENVPDMPGYIPWSPDVFVAPEPSSGLLLLIGGALLSLRRRRRAALVAGLVATGSVFAAPVVSSNIHGFVRIDPTTTHTLVSVPWTGYTPDGKETIPLPANRLVSPIGLAAGDLLMQATNEIAYATWSLEINPTTQARSWQPVMSATRGQDVFGQTRNTVWNHDGKGWLTRGGGIWVIRHNPLKADGVTPNPVYLYGQWTPNGSIVTVPGVVLGKTQTYGGYDACTYTMLANPDCTKETVINDIPWDPQLVGEKDTIVISNDKEAALVLFWEDPSDAAPHGRWYYTKTETEQRQLGSRTITIVKTVKAYDAQVPAGIGFWYVRRSADPLYVTWPGAGAKTQGVDVPEEENGEEK